MTYGLVERERVFKYYTEIHTQYMTSCTTIQAVNPKLHLITIKYMDGNKWHVKQLGIVCFYFAYCV